MFAPKDQKTIHETNRDFAVDMLIDTFSKRAWVNNYTCNNPERLTDFIFRACQAYGLGKIIFPARKEHLKELSKQGLAIEGWIEGFFQGRNGYFLTAYPEPGRAKSVDLPGHLVQLKCVMNSPRKEPVALPEGCLVVTPAVGDIPALTRVFKKVFASYPSPLDRPDYLAAVLGKTVLFRVVKQHGKIVSVAAAEVNRSNGCAELTNCATLPGARGAGMMSHLIRQLEQDCISRKVNCLYSLARASSFGMNLVFHRLGYRYRGTLVNNCHISGGFENMNIWVKYSG
ncbi:putative beta-lysine N-acetyltransferase [Desulfallas sp. Bu1-1]|uniref:putative beta-lysine N-acetyltransferase n=1 Tax=Desulfallas sp. Bu1-1 TaxID=2787620 RepID=UPI00189DCDE9|nr:putative beta-lysine N-acetyltransferase [Desulfallas sp. Bu1-1]MBF7082155.1 putative beta-lysine N-acetyltransferase [Desulfallas sp. Bu1-1]